ncbi:NADPH-dependent FMN reductase [Pseudopedobacter saltans DSM 12145]|uniref:NADPH-dependent FMN reductase n=1 Tax=Pseudopedobacter saltans (strain ATCC 51119 / DSM 12145 / JCM 21818 / CCUG 39354 / LMG 10337 / NBRC 100064 / NCIMB 13643) TaxID=762903 RepID=F0SEH4_PSESL|nr:NAD(P)H-dependent oxidoreductase [Pseudopedobacter saltans]ADY50839.1 NADPH-dependent FMN reductase [Pseudopedobacter saltans DSM 12145]
MKTLIVSGTNRLNSNTLKVSKYYQKILTEKNYESEILSLTDLPENLAATDLYGKRSEAFTKILQKVNEAEKFLFVIPEYNGSFPGILKLFIDACDFPASFYDKKAALVGLSSGKYGNIRGIDHFTGVCNYVHLNVMPLKIHLTYINKDLNDLGNFINEDTIKFVNQQIDKFIKY